ncbi:MAG: hypothetical protein ACTSWQ_10080 [Candidatus Thorarchaeota archaeon]
MSVELLLYDEVIADYEKEHPFKRYNTFVNNIGREDRRTIEFKATAMVRPIGTYDLTRQDPEGSRYEDKVKVYCRNDGSVDILLNDLVFFGGFWYRLTDVRGIEVSDFTMYIGELIKDRNS